MRDSKQGINVILLIILKGYLRGSEEDALEGVWAKEQGEFKLCKSRKKWWGLN